MSQRAGIYRLKDDKQTCLASGCDRKAIYLNAQSSNRGIKRGYCSKHRHMAIAQVSYKTSEHRMKRLEEYIDRLRILDS